ncbi:MAG: hypothetical protein JKY50_10850 [Oleispira sp.]|nr:hypothetical protein [Oleispira sp.]
MHTQQTGSALAISLILLTAITLVSITSLQRSGLQSRIVANSQHAENDFNAVYHDLEEKYQAYANDAVSADALQATIELYTTINGVKIYTETTNTGVTPRYDRKTDKNPHPSILTSRIVHEGQPPFTAGNSESSFTTYRFKVTTVANDPFDGRVLASQSIGIELIGPAIN